MPPAPPILRGSRNQQAIEALRRTFEQCRYRVFLHRRVIELRVGHAAGEAERLIPGCNAFSLITAWNPFALSVSRRQNLAADDRLANWLQRRRLPIWRALNGDGSWREASWLVGNPPMHPLDQFASRLGQIATLHWRRGEPVALRWHVDPSRRDRCFVDAGRPDP